MNEEMLKTSLLEMIKEADNLPESELEIVPGTRFRVKKGRVDEYKANARFYYQLTKNAEIKDEQYLREVYYELSDELAHEQKEHIFSKAYDLYDLGKEETDRLAKLNEALAKNKKQLEEYKSREESLKKDSQTNTNLWVEANKVQTERQELENTITYLNNLILKTTVELKDKVNNEVKKITAQEMEYLRNQITTVNKGVTTSWGIDGHNILKSDEEYYNNLWYLSNILNNVKDNLPLINVGNAIWVNHEQLASAQELVSKIDYLRLVKKEDAQALNQKPNDKLIAEISKELDYLRAENTSTSKLEYDRLTEILKYLNAANNNEFALTPVWNIAYVNGPDREAFTNLLKESSFFQKYNPDLKLIKKNQELILELKKYVSELEENYNKKVRESNVNVPGINYQNHIILESDKKELENVLAVISILENAKENLTELSVGGSVPSSLIPGYKKLISNIKYFTPKKEVYSLESNKELAKEIKLMMDNLNPENEQKHNLLAEMYDILTNVDLNKKVINLSGNFEGIILNEESGKKFQQIVEDIDRLDKKQETILTIDLAEKNQEKIAEIEKEIQSLFNIFSKVAPEHQKEYELLENLINLLSMKVPDSEIKEVNNVTISKEKEEEYLKILSDLEKLRNPIQEEVNFIDAGAIQNKKDTLKWVEENSDLLKSSEEVIKSLQEQINILENAKIKEDALYLLPEQIELYNKMEAELPIKHTAENEELISSLEKELQESSHQINPKKYDLLVKKLDLLKRSEGAYTDTIKVKDAYIPLRNAREYSQFCDDLEQIEEKNINEETNSEKIEEQRKSSEPESTKDSKIGNIKKKLVTSIRKAKKLEWWKKHKNIIIGIGLTILLVSSLSSLIPTILYTNGCLAAAIPGLAPGINAINVSIINALGIPLGSLNFSVASANLGGALLNSLLNLGVIGGSAFGIKEVYKQYRKENSATLSDPNEKSLTEKVKKLGSDLISKTKELSNTLSDKAAEFTKNLATQLDGNNMALEHDLLDLRVKVDPFIMKDENSEDKKTKERIDQRYEDLKKEQEEKPLSVEGEVIGEPPVSLEEEKRKQMASQTIDVPYSSVVLPSDEEIVEALEENLGRGK